MIKIRRYFFCALISIQVSTVAWADPPASTNSPAEIPKILNLKDIAAALNLKRFKNKSFPNSVKIAILDDGFANWQSEVGKSLPAGTKHPTAPTTSVENAHKESYHGTLLAKLVAQLIAESGADVQYELSLYESFGYTKFKWAVEQVITEQVDVVLYAQVWDNGGNGDGKGFINALVDEALKKDVIWINAAGNFGQLTRVSPVPDKQGFLNFPDGKDHVDLECEAPQDKTCNLDLTLSWNDFKDNPTTGTDKDLDLYLEQGATEVDVSNKIQVLSSDDTDPKHSHLPREEIVHDLTPGKYQVKVRVQSRNFVAQKDSLRLTAAGPGIKMDQPDIKETLLPPADNPGVLVVGASDDFNSSQSKALNLPKVLFKSLVTLENSAPAFESSNAAAMAAAVTVLNLGLGTPKTKVTVEAKLETLSESPTVAPVVAEGKAPRPKRHTSPRVARPESENEESIRSKVECLEPAHLAYPSQPVDLLLSQGRGFATFVNGQYAIAVNYDFWTYMGYVRSNEGQRLMIGPNGVFVVNEFQMPYLPRGTYEIISTPLHLCE